MPQTKRGRSQDRRKVAAGQKHEVAYASDKAGVSAEALKTSVKKVGNSQSKVEAEVNKPQRRVAA